jgi:hypothetical protein
VREFFNAALNALPAVATSPLALIAYLAPIAAWVVLALRAQRNQQLLQHLEKLPERDRLKALEAEMGHVRLESGLRPEEFLRSKVNTYIFFGFLALLLLIAVLFAIAAATTSRSSPGIAAAVVTLFTGGAGGVVPVDPKRPSITLTEGDQKVLTSGTTPVIPDQQQQATAPADTPVFVRNEENRSGSRDAYAAPDFTVTYAAERQGDTISISPRMPYLSLLATGGPIRGIQYHWTPFLAEFPQLSVKIVNNTDRVVLLTEAVVKINTSSINAEPVLVVKENPWNTGRFSIINEGWGSLIDPVVNFGLAREEDCNSSATITANMNSQPVAFSDQTDSAGTEQTDIDVSHYVPEGLSGKKIICVFGEIHYANYNQDSRAIKFKTKVWLEYPGPGAPAPPSYFYDLFLEAGKSN